MYVNLGNWENVLKEVDPGQNPNKQISKSTTSVTEGPPKQIRPVNPPVTACQAIIAINPFPLIHRLCHANGRGPQDSWRRHVTSDESGLDWEGLDWGQNPPKMAENRKIQWWNSFKPIQNHPNPLKPSQSPLKTTSAKNLPDPLQPHEFAYRLRCSPISRHIVLPISFQAQSPLGFCWKVKAHAAED